MSDRDRHPAPRRIPESERVRWLAKQKAKQREAKRAARERYSDMRPGP
jgi:hypothetical protein